MTQEEKQLVFKDLCARLPYGVVVETTYIPENNGYTSKISANTLDFVLVDNWSVKPYLRPMSSMTDEEREEWADLFNLELDKLNEIDDEDKAEELAPYYFGKSHQVSIDWLNKNMFDYRGLIPMGLALEAKEGMYKNE